MLSKTQAAAEVMLHLCEHAAHGYSQPARKGDGTTESVRLSDGSTVQVHGGDYDCSEAVRQCWEAVGVLPSGSYMWTGNEDELLTANGFVRLPFVKSTLQVGDVLWKEGHTEMIVRPGMQGGFNGDEKGGIGIGAKVGDQTGYESYVKPIRDYWTRVYRYSKPYTAQWVKSADGRWWWRNEDGSYPRDAWKKIAGSWYLFDKSGWMLTGWQKRKGKWYYLRTSGAMVAGRPYEVDGKWYAFDKSGAMIEGAVQLRKGGSMIL